MMVKDLVCGMELDSFTANYQTVYKGQTYYFCSREDKETFDEHPERYIKSQEKEEEEM